MLDHKGGKKQPLKQPKKQAIDRDKGDKALGRERATEESQEAKNQGHGEGPLGQRWDYKIWQKVSCPLYLMVQNNPPPFLFKHLDSL